MGQLVMSFRGLWIHVNQGWWPGDDLPHHVVAVDASLGAPGFRGGLPPHFCYVEAMDTVTKAFENAGIPLVAGILPLGGWNLSVANASNDLSNALSISMSVTNPNANAELTRIPQLTTFDESMRLLPVIAGEPGAPIWAVCVVDISHGKVTAGQFPAEGNDSRGGLYTTWTVDTDGPPRLLLTSRTGEQLPIPLTDCSGPPLSDGVPGCLVLHNSTTDFTDKNLDFALYYLAAAGGIPSFAGLLPGESSPTPTKTDLGTSCSNSQYP